MVPLLLLLLIVASIYFLKSYWVPAVKTENNFTRDLNISPIKSQSSKTPSVKEWSVEAVGVVHTGGLALDEKILNFPIFK